MGEWAQSDWRRKLLHARRKVRSFNHFCLAAYLLFFLFKHKKKTFQAFTHFLSVPPLGPQCMSLFSFVKKHAFELWCREWVTSQKFETIFCRPSVSLFYFSAIPNIISPFSTLLLPIPIHFLALLSSDSDLIFLFLSLHLPSPPALRSKPSELTLLMNAHAHPIILCESKFKFRSLKDLWIEVYGWFTFPLKKSNWQKTGVVIYRNKDLRAEKKKLFLLDHTRFRPTHA